MSCRVAGGRCHATPDTIKQRFSGTSSRIQTNQDNRAHVMHDVLRRRRRPILAERVRLEIEVNNAMSFECVRYSRAS